MKKRLEVTVYIPVGRTSEKQKIKAFVNEGARELDKDELTLFSSGAEEVTDKSFNVYKKFSDKAGVEAQGNVDGDPLHRVICYKSTKYLI